MHALRLKITVLIGVIFFLSIGNSYAQLLPPPQEDEQEEIPTPKPLPPKPPLLEEPSDPIPPSQKNLPPQEDEPTLLSEQELEDLLGAVPVKDEFIPLPTIEPPPLSERELDGLLGAKKEQSDPVTREAEALSPEEELANLLGVAPAEGEASSDQLPSLSEEELARLLGDSSEDESKEETTSEAISQPSAKSSSTNFASNPQQGGFSGNIVEQDDEVEFINRSETLTVKKKFQPLNKSEIIKAERKLFKKIAFYKYKDSRPSNIRLGYSGLNGNEATRNVSFAQAETEYKLGAITLGIGGSYSQQHIEYIGELRPIFSDAEAYQSYEGNSRTVNEGDIKAEGTYLGLQLGKLRITSGIRTVVWGQFNNHSPIDSMLPLRNDVISPDLSKEENRLPQTVHQLSVPLGERLGVELYRFPNYEVDVVTAKTFSKELNSNVYDGNIGNAISAPLPSVPKGPRDAIRLLFTPNWGMLGFTYYKGHDFLLQDFSLLTPLATGRYYAAPQPAFPSFIGRGIELAIQNQDYAFKLERLERGGIYTNLYWAGMNVASGQSGVEAEQHRALSEWVLNNNSRKLYLEQKVTTNAVGFELNDGNRKVSLAVYGISETFTEAKSQVGYQIYQNIYNEPSVSTMLSFQYEVNLNKGVKAGLASGLIGPAFGYRAYAHKTFNNKIQTLLAYDSLRYVNDENVNLSIEYRQKENTLTGLRLALLYKI